MEEITVDAGYIQQVEESGTSVLKLCTRRTFISKRDNFNFFIVCFTRCTFFLKGEDTQGPAKVKVTRS